jgi:hypothetical protein
MDAEMAMGESFAYYWETQRYLESEELDRCASASPPPPIRHCCC